VGNAAGEDTKWGLEGPREDVALALFDLRDDPGEQANVANDPRYLKLADWFRNELDRIVLGDGRIESNWSVENET